jgi:hypothetical protein
MSTAKPINAAAAAIHSKVINLMRNTKWETYIFISLFVIALIVIFMNTFSNISILTKASDNENVNSGNTTVYLILNIFILLIVIFFIGFYIYRLINSRSIDSFLIKGIDLKDKNFNIPVYVGPPTSFEDSIPVIADYKLWPTEEVNLRPNACKSKTECKSGPLKDGGRAIPDPRNSTGCKDSYGSRNLNAKK